MENTLQVATEYYTHTKVVFHISLQEAEQRVINRSSVLLIYDEISLLV